MDHYRVLTITILVSVICSVAAIASEEFVLSATDGANIILKTYELDQNQIKKKDSNVIETNNPIVNTAVTFRNDNSALVFDVYYAACPDILIDIECVNATLSMTRVDSNLNLIFEKGFTIPIAYSLATERFQKPSGVSLRLLLEDRSKVAERELHGNGIPGPLLTVAFRNGSAFRSPSAAEDGKMVAASAGKNGSHFIEVRTFNPKGPIREMQTDDLAWSLTLSGPVTGVSQSLSGGSPAKPYRFLFFRVFRNFGTQDLPNLQSRIMRQRIDDSTGNFIGTPKAFTTFKAIQYYVFAQSVTVAPGANVVFFAEFDTSCRKQVLWAQVFNPQTRTKVGPPQLLIECSELLANSAGIQGIDVAQFRP